MKHGIDYLALVHAEHQQGTSRSISFADMHDGPGDSGEDGGAAAWDEPPLPFPDQADSSDDGDSDSDEPQAEVAR